MASMSLRGAVWACGCATVLALATACYFHQTAGLNLVTVLLALASIIYIWTNG